jgi:mRNA-degrading endonuclease RelE of RelBE toxin-antitoxin system
MKGSQRYRLRVGDYRVIYALDFDQNTMHLLAEVTGAKSIDIFDRSAMFVSSVLSS